MADLSAVSSVIVVRVVGSQMKIMCRSASGAAGFWFFTVDFHAARTSRRRPAESRAAYLRPACLKAAGQGGLKSVENSATKGLEVSTAMFRNCSEATPH